VPHSPNNDNRTFMFGLVVFIVTVGGVCAYLGLLDDLGRLFR